LAGTGSTYKDNIIVSELNIHYLNVDIKLVGITKPEECFCDVLVHPFMRDTSKGV
jgi:hypothetical protein